LELASEEMRIRVFHKFDSELKTLWQDLESRAEPYIFQSYFWLSHWQETIGNESPRTEPSIVLLENSDGPQALIPFCLEQRCGVRVLGFLGGDQSDYHCPVVTKQGKKSLHQPNIWQEIFGVLPKHDVLHIDKIPESFMVEKLLPIQDARCILFNHAFATDIPSSWEEFQKGLNSRIKSDSRRQRKRLAERGKLHFENMAPKSEKSKMAIETFFKQKRSRFQATGARDTLSFPSSKRFYSDIFHDLGAGNKVIFSVLWLNENIIATHLGAVDHERFYFLMPTFSPEWENYSPGRLILEHLIQWSIEQGLKVFDFTVGEEEYKKAWCNLELKLFEILKARTLIGELYVQSLMSKRALKQFLMIVNGVRLTRKWWNSFTSKILKSK